jgi:hypothetical protein
MDRYAKAVLTMIAGTLVIIATQLAIPAARAVVGECGGYQNEPCTVYFVYQHRYEGWQPCVDGNGHDQC